MIILNDFDVLGQLYHAAFQFSISHDTINKFKYTDKTEVQSAHNVTKWQDVVDSKLHKTEVTQSIVSNK